MLVKVAAPDPEVTISLNRLTKMYGSTLGIKDVTFDVRAGEVLGFLGPNGAGKTTTIRTLLGLIKATSGEATILGRNALIQDVDLRLYPCSIHSRCLHYSFSTSKVW